MIDLHTHSTFSDGTFTPDELCKMAITKGLTAIALTDHDTIDGIESFINTKWDIIKIPGTEISLEIKKGTFHMLGLFINYKNKRLRDSLDKLKKYRKTRNEKILKNLSDFFNEEILEHHISDENEGELGRPHIAKFLVKKGIVNSVQEAFDKYLAKGQRFYVSKSKLQTEEAISIILESGGIPVLAHPITLNLEKEEFEEFVKDLVGIGLKGIEAICPLHSKSDCNFYTEIANKYNLLITGGSDFHGTNKNDVFLGNLGECSLTEEQIDTVLKVCR